MAITALLNVDSLKVLAAIGWIRIKDRTRSLSWLKLTASCVAAVFGTAFTATLYLYRFKPKIIVQAIFRWNQKQSGLMAKCIKDRTGFNYSYAERGKNEPGKPTIIFVPGLMGSIDNWVPVVKQMSTRHHMIAVEMVAGGSTTVDPETDLTVLGQVERLKQFLELMKLDAEKLHLVGAATGGTVVGCYAAMFPEMVVKLTLICPALRSPLNGDAVKMELAGEDSGLLFSSPDTVERSLELISTKTRHLNKQMAKGFYELKKHNLVNARKLANSMIDDIWRGDEDTLLIPRLEKITAPTQVIWGQHDRIIHVSGAELLKNTLRNCVSVNILPSGHSIYMDQPKKLAELLEQFIAKPQS